MFQNLIRFEKVIGDKAFHFICDPSSPIEHVKEALFQCLKDVGAIEDSIKAQAAQQAQTAPAPEQSPSEKIIPLEQPNGNQ